MCCWKVCLIGLFLHVVVAQQPNDNAAVQMPPQIADEEDPCGKRHHVEIGQTCAFVATANHLTIDELLLLNPGLKCNPFFSDVNLCVDHGASGRVLDDAIAASGYRILSRQEMEENLAGSHTPAVEPDTIDTGNGR
ncbi:hypothetical protein BV898_11279 [Hypsibius exemplaris]|uniref:LysM domain-containing protein n=1 Tax=Hypsibius exemplaris TaxID=2072580 RepID=A0A1W0WH78_HYPEX|nr:hypothetical protein BV898_11279 [Hypsibius exemplaris]